MKTPFYLFFLLISVPAFAQYRPDAYVSLKGGIAELASRRDNVITVNGIESPTIHGSDVAFSLAVGKWVARDFRVELDYSNFNETEGNVEGAYWWFPKDRDDPDDDEMADMVRTMSAQTITFSALFEPVIPQFRNFRLFGGLGLGVAMVEDDLNINSRVSSLTSSQGGRDETVFTAVGQVGMVYDFTPSIAGELSARYYWMDFYRSSNIFSGFAGIRLSF